MTSLIDKLAYIDLKDKKVLMTLSRGKDTWYIPGGKREGTETDQEALTREVKEELLVDLIPDTIQYYGTFEAQAHGKPEGVIVRMTCYTGKFTGTVAANAEIEKFEYFPYAKKPLGGPVDHIIFDDLHEKGLLL